MIIWYLRKHCEIVGKTKESYSRIDSDIRELLEMAANVKIPEACKVLENGEERFDKCYSISLWVYNRRHM